MAQDLEKLVVSLEANLKQYERELARAQKTTVTSLRRIEGDMVKGAGRIEKSFARAGSVVAGFGKGLVIGGVFAAVAGLEELVRGSITSAAAIGDLSDKLGITSTKLQELQFGAVQANMDFGELEKNLLKLSKSFGEARNGSGELLQTLQANGFDQAQIRAMTYGEALDVVADLIRNAATEQDAMVIATQAFGRAGDDMLEFLRNGSEGLKGFATDAHKAGAVIDAELIKSAQVFDDAWSAALLNIKSGIASFVLSVINDLSNVNAAVNAIATSRAAILQQGTRFGPTTPAAGPAPIVKIPQTVAPGKGNLGNTILPNKEEAGLKIAGTKAATKAHVDQQKAISGVIEALKFEGEQLTRSDLQQQINLELRKAGVTATSEQGKAIAALVTKNFEYAESVEGLIKADEARLETQQQINDSLFQLAEIGVSAFDAIVVGGEKAGDVLKGLVKQLASAAIQATLLGQGPLAGLFGGGGGFFGSLLGRASGGHVNAGQPYMVGEKGREIFVPKQSGAIIPSTGGGQNIVFAPRIDARGADAGAIARLTADLRAMQRDFAKNVKSAVTYERSRNPGFAR